MKAQRVKRMHTEDARFLRDLLLFVIRRVDEVEEIVGGMQRGLVQEPEGSAEIVEL